MLSKAMIFREIKSESGFSFAMASQPFKVVFSSYLLLESIEACYVF